MIPEWDNDSGPCSALRCSYARRPASGPACPLVCSNQIVRLAGSMREIGPVVHTCEYQAYVGHSETNAMKAITSSRRCPRFLCTLPQKGLRILAMLASIFLLSFFAGTSPYS